jgi:hypothetical protein
MSSTGAGDGELFLFPMDLGGPVTNGNLKVLLRGGRVWPSPAPDVAALRSDAIKFSNYLVVKPPEELANNEAAVLRCFEALKAAIRARGTVRVMEDLPGLITGAGFSGKIICVPAVKEEPDGSLVVNDLSDA